MEFLSKFLKDILTGLDGQSYDVGRVLLAVAFIIGVVLEVYCTVMRIPFDLQQYGIGIGSMLVAGGGALLLKSKTEPGDTNANK